MGNITWDENVTMICILTAYCMQATLEGNPQLCTLCATATRQAFTGT